MYLIDDIFSAVDPGVADHIYRACLGGLLAERTRVLCTHHTRFLAQADLVLCLQEGRITEAGPPQGTTSKFWDFLTAFLTGVKNELKF